MSTLPLGRRLAVALAVSLAAIAPMLEGAISFEHSSLVLVTAGTLWLAVAVGLSAPARLAARVLSLGIALAALGLAAAGVDLAGRLFVPDLIAVRPDNRYIERWPRLPLVYRLTPNVVYDRTLYGDLALITAKPEDRELRHVRFVTDSYGFRDTAPAPASVDVVILGDSFAMGSGTSQEQTLAAYLQADGLSVYNEGVGLSSPWQEYVNFAEEMDRVHLKPGGTILWLTYTGNDLLDGYGDTKLARLPWLDPFQQWMVSYDTFRNRSPIQQISSAFDRYGQAAPIQTFPFVNGRRMLFYIPQAEQSALSLAEVKQHENYPRLADTIQAMGKLARSHDFNLAVVVLPTKDEVYSWVYHHTAPWSSDPSPSGFSRAVGQISRAQNLCFLDLKPDLIAQSRTVYEQSGDVLYWYDDSHWSGTGQAVSAQVLAARLCLTPGGGGFCCAP